MPDYGHPLVFGAFITPTNASPQLPVQLAVFAEQVGLDLVTFQDHPYQPAFHDTWTLLSYVAARTERIHLSGNVLNLPLRQPAVLARAAASLDLLSGGRFDFGLGAGGFWDAIEAMGGQRLTPGESVQALEEAIGIIRGIWAVGDRGPLRVHGEFHQVDGAKRGPLPAHDIPIWLGAYKPRMQRLIGRAADGWLPSYGYLKPGDIEAGNQIIDEAATAAGRDPREVRRILNIPPDVDAERITELAVEHGFGTFILASDDPRALQHFAQEVAPAVREAVDAARLAAGTDTSRPRGAAALALRREGIDYDAIPASLRERAVEPGDPEYARLKSNYLRGGEPGIILRPRSTDEVVDAVRWAGEFPDLPLGVRSAGHGISGRSTNDGGIVIDLHALDAIEVLDGGTRMVRVGPGATWQQVNAAIADRGWAISSGDYGGVGVGGLATAGGIGFLVREHGLTIDRLRAAEIVLADGSVVRASETERPELFWGIRGAGGQLGIVTSFEFEASPIGDVAWVQLTFDASDPVAFLVAYSEWQEAAPRDTTLFAIVGGGRAQLYGVVDADDPDTILARLQPLVDRATLLDQSIALAPYAAVIGNASNEPHRGRGEPVSRSGLLEQLTPEFAQDAASLLRSGAIQWFQLRPLGGAFSDVDPDATAFAARNARMSLVVMGSDPSVTDAAFDRLRPHFIGTYGSFDSDPRPERLTELWPPAALERLRALKREVDPQNRFRDNHSVSGDQPVALGTLAGAPSTET